VVFNNPFGLKFSEKTVADCKKSAQTIVSILSQWAKLLPPKGFEARFNTIINVLPDDSFDDPEDDPSPKTSATIELYFAPYLWSNEMGKYPDYEFATKVTIYVNYLSGYLPGSSIAKNIYVCPLKTADFYGASIYQTNRQEITIFSKSGVPLFLPVSQEEFLKEQIKDAQKKSSPAPQKEDMRKQIESTYQSLLKLNKEEAEEFKKESLKGLDEMGTVKSIDMAGMLKKELQSMSSTERKRQGVYSLGALEKYNNASGLCPKSGLDDGDPLVKINPELLGTSGSGDIRLLVIGWEKLRMEDGSYDKPRFFKGKEKYDNLHIWNMGQLYLQKEIWQKVFSLVPQ